MKRGWIWFLAVIGLLLASCGEVPADGVSPATDPSIADTTETTQYPEMAEDSSAIYQNQADKILSKYAVFFAGSGTACIKGTTVTLTPAPFLEEGVLYVPAAGVTALLGGSFVRSDDVYYLNYSGNVSVFMEAYNVMLFNFDSVIMDRTPVVRDGVLCLPLSTLSKALSLRCSKSVSQGVYVLGGEEWPEEGAFALIRQRVLGESLPYTPQPRLQQIARTWNLDAARLEQAAGLKQLWITDEFGVIRRLWMDDSGQLREEIYEMSARYPANQVYVKINYQIRSLNGTSVLEESPEETYQRELRNATGRYMELLAASCLLEDARAEELMPVYKAALAGNLTQEAYLQDMLQPYDTGVYTGAAGEEAWKNLVETARPGDFLVFSASGAGPEYGFFNHSALILEVDIRNHTLRLLHARSSEYGVGADLDMDRLSYGGFSRIPYYENYETVFLCRAGELTRSQAEQMAWKAYGEFNGCQFGYGGRLGLEETNCAELIVDAYAMADIRILDDGYETRLKEVLKGNTKNLVPVPDDLLLSGNVEVLALWKR